MRDEDGRAPTSLRGLLILEALALSERPLRLSELGAALGLPKQTAHRLCSALQREGFLERQPDGRYAAGPRLRALAPAVLLPDHRRVARRKVMERVSAALGETCNLVVPETEGMTSIDRIATHWPLRIQLPVGSHVPFHCTASGKLYLSSLGKTAQRRLVGALDLERWARNTCGDAAALRRQLKAIAARGYSTDNEEMIDGLVALAVPVRDGSGQFMAALAVHGPMPRFSIAKAEEHLPLLREAARELALIIAGSSGDGSSGDGGSADQASGREDE